MTIGDKAQLGQRAIAEAVARSFVAHSKESQDIASIQTAVMREIACECDSPTTRMTIVGLIGHNSQAADFDTCNAILRTGIGLAHSWRNYLSLADLDYRQAFPYLELVVEEKEAKPWKSKWRSAGGRVTKNRLVAHHQSDIWSKLSRFGLPFGPFDFEVDYLHYTEAVSDFEAHELRLPIPQLKDLGSVDFSKLFDVFPCEVSSFIASRALAIESYPEWVDDEVTEEFCDLIGRLLKAGTLDSRGFVRLVKWLRTCPNTDKEPINCVYQAVASVLEDGKATSGEQSRVEEILKRLISK